MGTLTLDEHERTVNVLAVEGVVHETEDGEELASGEDVCGGEGGAEETQNLAGKLVSAHDDRTGCALHAPSR